MAEEFCTRWTSDAQIEVVDVAEDHVWTFTLAENGHGERILSPTVQRSPDHARATVLAGRAHRLAEREAFRDGRIDRSVAP